MKPYAIISGMKYLLIALAILPHLVGAAEPESKPMGYWVYIGTNTHKTTSKGIYVLRFDLPDGKLSGLQLAAESANPTFLAIHPGHKFLYAVGEMPNGPGAIRAFAIDSQTGKLALLNEQSSGGTGPCFVSVDKAGKNALAANYGSGSVAVLPIGDDGKLAAPTSQIQHVGSGPNKKRQTGPHAHSINLDPTQQFAFAADLGCDKLFIYRFDGTKGTLTANDPAFATVAPGSGPRHLAFHPNGKFAYVINEMGNTISAFSYDSTRGALSEIQAVPTLAPRFTGENTGAEVQVHPSGKFLYGSNRGENDLVIYSIDSETGKLKLVGHQSTAGAIPRNFAIDPTGEFLIAANQNSNSLVLFRIEPNTGRLWERQKVENVPVPICVKFLAIGG
jgi:6-phosphogluconolactonase